MNTLETKPSSIQENPPHPAPHGSATIARNSNTNLGRWAWIVLLLILLGLAFGTIPRLWHRKALVKETKALAISSVRVISAVPGKATATLILPAELRPFEEAPIYARASGFVKRWYVDIGGRVEAGQPLADIDAPELTQQLTQSQAELVQAQAAESLSKITADRWAELLKTSSVSAQEDAEKHADMQLKVATVDAAKANVDRLRDVQSFTHVVAPFTGILTARDIDVGDLITPGKELFRLADVTKLRVYVRVPQTATPGVAPGLSADITVPELPSRKFEAKVVRTAGAIDPGSRTLLTELAVDNSKNELVAGSFAQVSFGDLKQDPTLVLPANTLLFRSEGLQVGVVSPDGKVELRSITMGRDFGKTVEVVAGLTPQDRIIVNPADSLTAGSTVRIVEAAVETVPAGKAK